jgi:Flp pilus assembly protein TadD
MSLLNDALRKKQSEAQPPQPFAAAAFFKRGPGRHLQKRHWVAGIGAAIVLLVAAGAWGWWQRAAGDGTIRPTAAQRADLTAAAPIAETAEAPRTIPDHPGAPIPLPSPAPTVAPEVAPTEAQPRPIQIPMPTRAPESPRVTAATQGAAAPATPAVQRRPAASGPAPQPAAWPEQRITGEPLYRKAHLFQRQGRATEALAMYREVLKLDPNHFDTRLNMSAIYLETGQFTQAQALAADLHREAPAHAQALLNLAIAQIGCGQAVEALPLLDQAAALPQAPLYTIYFHKGVALRQLGQTEAAIAWYRKAEALNPGDGRLLFNLALALDQNQDYAQAVDYYLKYLTAAKDELDAAGRRPIQARLRALQAELTAAENGEPKP